MEVSSFGTSDSHDFRLTLPMFVFQLITWLSWHINPGEYSENDIPQKVVLFLTRASILRKQN